jgi:hypothetical protein
MVMPQPAPSNLVLKPLYTAIFLAFAQDLEDRVIYGPFGIIYGPISHCQFLFSPPSLSFGFVIGEPTHFSVF